MKEFSYTVEDPNGMHARPAGKLATFAKQFDAEIRVIYRDREADAKRLLSLMSLGAVHGGVLCFRITGADEEAARQAMERFCKESWGSGA
ncbi:MAG: HPr family phosphocarrier protein [Ruminococcaceae bacterium]|nr:HPr family phosphocarrier protein [Oscillospiraceae bacterium]